MIQASILLYVPILHSVSKENDTDVAHYNFNEHQPIFVIFDTDVAGRVCCQMVICYPTSPVSALPGEMLKHTHHYTTLFDFVWDYPGETAPERSTSWSGTLYFILHTFLHPIIVFFVRHMPIHHNLFCCSTKIMSSNPSLSRNPLLGTQNLMNIAFCLSTEFCCGFPTSFLHRHVGAPMGWYPTFVLLRAIFWVLWCKWKKTEANINNPTGHHNIQTNRCSNLHHPHHFYTGWPSCRNPPNLYWLGTGTKYAGLHAQQLGRHQIINKYVHFTSRMWPFNLEKSRNHFQQ